METTRRTLAKALSWQAVGLVSMTLLGFALSGSWRMGGQFALFSALTGLALYVIHERIWARVRWGRREV